MLSSIQVHCIVNYLYLRVQSSPCPYKLDKNIISLSVGRQQLLFRRIQCSTEPLHKLSKCVIYIKIGLQKAQSYSFFKHCSLKNVDSKISPKTGRLILSNQSGSFTARCMLVRTGMKAQAPKHHKLLCSHISMVLDKKIVPIAQS